MRNTFAIKIKLLNNEKFFRNFRCALGTMRQRRNLSAVELDRILRMQDLCGDIEMSLYAAKIALERKGRS